MCAYASSVTKFGIIGRSNQVELSPLQTQLLQTNQIARNPISGRFSAILLVDVGHCLRFFVLITRAQFKLSGLKSVQIASWPRIIFFKPKIFSSPF